jgi:hypothetical protein
MSRNSGLLPHVNPNQGTLPSNITCNSLTASSFVSTPSLVVSTGSFSQIVTNGLKFGVPSSGQIINNSAGHNATLTLPTTTGTLTLAVTPTTIDDLASFSNVSGQLQDSGIASSSLVTLNGVQTLTNKTIQAGVFTNWTIDDTADPIALNGSNTICKLTSVMKTSAIQSVYNKSFEDISTVIFDTSDTSKTIGFDAGGTASTKTTLTCAQTANRVITFPDATDTLVGRSTTDTLTNKTLTNPIINGISLNSTPSCDPIALNGTTGAVERWTNYADTNSSQFLTNKTIDSSTNAITITNSPLSGTNINSLVNQDVRTTASPSFQTLSLSRSVSGSILTLNQSAATDVFIYFPLHGSIGSDLGVPSIYMSTIGSVPLSFRTNDTERLVISGSGVSTDNTQLNCLGLASDGKTIIEKTNIVDTSTTQTLTNKTLTSPIISTIVNTGTLTLPTTTGTLALVSQIPTNATYVDLTNPQTISGVKTFSAAPIISTITNTGTLTLPTTTDTIVGRATTDTLTNKTLSPLTAIGTSESRLAAMLITNYTTTTTTNAAQTTILTIATTSNTSIMVTTNLTCFCSAGTHIGKGRSFQTISNATNNAGTVTIDQVVANASTGATITATTISHAVSGTDVIVRVTGINADTFLWSGTTQINY